MIDFKKSLVSLIATSVLVSAAPFAYGMEEKKDENTEFPEGTVVTIRVATDVPTDLLEEEPEDGETVPMLGAEEMRDAQSRALKEREETLLKQLAEQEKQQQEARILLLEEQLKAQQLVTQIVEEETRAQVAKQALLLQQQQERAAAEEEARKQAELQRQAEEAQKQATARKAREAEEEAAAVRYAAMPIIQRVTPSTYRNHVEGKLQHLGEEARNYGLFGLRMKDHKIALRARDNTAFADQVVQHQGKLDIVMSKLDKLPELKDHMLAAQMRVYGAHKTNIQ